MSEENSNMSAENANVYQAPEADLTSTNTNNKPILEFKRFSAWGVFFLSLITLGIYNIFWLSSRVNTANSLAKQAPKISPMLVNIYGGLIGINIVATLFLSNPAAANGTAIASWILLLVLVFKLRAALTEIINEGSAQPVIIGPIKTFFFTIIYLQYKINEAIDTQSN